MSLLIFLLQGHFPLVQIAGVGRALQWVHRAGNAPSVAASSSPLGPSARCSVRGRTARCSVRARGSYLWRLVLWRRVWWISPPGCDWGFRNEQERDDYAAPALLDDFEPAIWS